MVRRVFRSSRGYMTSVDEMPAQDPAIGDTGIAARNPGFPSMEFKSPFTLSKANNCHSISQAKRTVRPPHGVSLKIGMPSNKMRQGRGYPNY